MSLVQNLNKLEESDEFKEFIKNHPKAFLCACFFLDGNWKIDYFCDEKITTFNLGSDIMVEETNEILKGEDKIRKLDVEKVNIEMDKAIEIADGVLGKKYPNESANKKIVILQNIKMKIVWNITYLTSGFNIFNIRIDAKNGDIVEEKLNPVASGFRFMS